MKYEQPVSRYNMQNLCGASLSTISANFINFNNVEFITHDGLIFDKTNNIQSYKFQDRVEKVSNIVNKNDQKLIVFFFTF